MHNIEVLLVVSAPNAVEPRLTKFLVKTLDNGLLSLPESCLDEGWTTLETAADLLNELTGLEAKLAGKGWVNLKQCPLADNVDRKRYGRAHPWIAVPFGCMIPEVVTANSSEGYSWLTFNELTERKWFGDHFEILTSVVTQI